MNFRITAPLTDREMQVVKLMADGHNEESVASQMDIAKSTVRIYRGRIHEKLAVNSALEVVAWYYKLYWRPKDETAV